MTQEIIAETPERVSTVDGLAVLMRQAERKEWKPPAKRGKYEGRKSMKIKTITDEDSGRRWEIYKRADNQYYYKYYEFFRATGWRLTGQSGGNAEGYYYTKASIEWEFETTVA